MQAALGALPLDQINRAYSPNDPRYAEYRRYGEDALVTSVFCILICGSIGTLLIRWFSGILLDKVRPFWGSAAPVLKLSLSDWVGRVAAEWHRTQREEQTSRDLYSCMPAVSSLLRLAALVLHFRQEAQNRCTRCA